MGTTRWVKMDLKLQQCVSFWTVLDDTGFASGCPRWDTGESGTLLILVDPPEVLALVYPCRKSARKPAPSDSECGGLTNVRHFWFNAQNYRIRSFSLLRAAATRVPARLG